MTRQNVTIAELLAAKKINPVKREKSRMVWDFDFFDRTAA